MAVATFLTQVTARPPFDDRHTFSSTCNIELNAMEQGLKKTRVSLWDFPFSIRQWPWNTIACKGSRRTPATWERRDSREVMDRLEPAPPPRGPLPHKHSRCSVCAHGAAMGTSQLQEDRPEPETLRDPREGPTGSAGDTFSPFLFKLRTPSSRLEPLPRHDRPWDRPTGPPPRRGCGCRASNLSLSPTQVPSCARSLTTFSPSFLGSCTSLRTGVLIDSLRFQNAPHGSAEQAYATRSSALKSSKGPLCLLGESPRPRHLTQTDIPLAPPSVRTCALPHWMPPEPLRTPVSPSHTLLHPRLLKACPPQDPARMLLLQQASHDQPSQDPAAS